MKLIHFIPAAFNYFDDIQEHAFGIVHELGKKGIEQEVFTFEYGAPSRQRRSRLNESAPSRHYSGTSPRAEVFGVLSNYDAVVWHCPSLGGAQDILRALARTPVPMVLAYHHDLQFTDLFSLIIRLYNGYYLPRLAKSARGVVYLNPELCRVGRRWCRRAEKFSNFSLTDSDSAVQLPVGERSAQLVERAVREILK